MQIDLTKIDSEKFKKLLNQIIENNQVPVLMSKYYDLINSDELKKLMKHTSTTALCSQVARNPSELENILLAKNPDNMSKKNIEQISTTLTLLIFMAGFEAARMCLKEDEIQQLNNMIQ